MSTRASRPTEDLAALRASIVANLARALQNATARLADSAAGKSTFTSDVDLKATLALLKTLPLILPLLPEPDDDDDDFDEDSPNEDSAEGADDADDAHDPLATWDPTLPCPIPPCPICSAPPGGHWSHHCPQQQPEHNHTKLMSQQSFWAAGYKACSDTVPDFKSAISSLKSQLQSLKSEVPPSPPPNPQSEIPNPQSQLSHNDSPLPTPSTLPPDALSPKSQDSALPVPSPVEGSTQDSALPEASTQDCNLTDRQLAAMNMMLSGATDTDIAAALSIARKTLYNWRTHHEEFRATLAARRQSLFDNAADRVRAMLTRALDNFDRHLADPWTPTNLRASRSILHLSRLTARPGHFSDQVSRTIDTPAPPGSHPRASVFTE